VKLEPKFVLGSYLLKPVQRICKYPLLLRELSKCTEENAAEHAQIIKGLEAMKAVTVFINELKKRREAMELVRQLEAKIENWDEVFFLFFLFLPFFPSPLPITSERRYARVWRPQV